jgi:RHS repeat-associated protein
MRKNTGHRITPAWVLGIWLLGTLSGHCFCNPEDRSDQALAARAADSKAPLRWKYGPFGEAVRATGPMAKVNPFRFSTKYEDDETDLVYYGYRYYSASTGRWLSRDPLAEKTCFERQLLHASERMKQILRSQALLPPYLFTLNDSINRIDMRGMWVARPDPPPANVTTIVCQGGKAVPRLGPDTSLNSRCVNRCILSHERAHAQEANAQGACAGKPDGVAVAASTTAERVSSETKAYQRELKCLLLSKEGATPPDPNGQYPKDCACRLGNVESYIDTVTRRLAAWENANPDDTSTWPQDDL